MHIVYIFFTFFYICIEYYLQSYDQGFLELSGSSGGYRFLENLFKRLAEVETTLIIYRSLLFAVFALGVFALFVVVQESVLLLLLFISLFYMNSKETT